MNQPPKAQSGDDDITCALSSAPGFWGAWTTYLGFCWRKQKWPWCCPYPPAPICCPGSHQSGFLQCFCSLSRLEENCVCLYPPWSWGHHGGTVREGCVPCAFSALWLECCEEPSILCVREIPLAFCVRAGFTGNRSLVKTFLAQHFSHLQAVVTGTAQKPLTTSSSVDVWQGGSRSGEQGLTQGCFNWRHCCGFVYQWVGDNLVSSQPCSLVIALRDCNRIFGSSLCYRVTGVESWICSPGSW